MSRIILTFENLFQVLSADKILRGVVSCRPTPTPPGLGSAICGVSLELLDHAQRETTMNLLEKQTLTPNGVHEIT